MRCHICKWEFDPDKVKLTLVRGQFKDGKLTMIVCPRCAKALAKFASTQPGAVVRTRKINRGRPLS